MSDEHAAGQMGSQVGLPMLGSALDGETGRVLTPGEIIADKYRLDARLGRGAMGAVWAATHLGLGEPVALKFIDPRFASSPEARHRFETEARATAKIRSRFVVSVFDTGQLDDGTLYLVMERLRGETLHAYVKRTGPLRLDEAVGYACHVGRALGHAHARGIIHRDVKPSNIFLADTPDDGRVAKVLDFGVAKLSAPLEGLAVGQTSAGALLGTPQYMSPEQARGQGAVDHRTDVYSLGLVFFRMYAGRPLRTAGPIGDLIARILTEPLPALRTFRADAPPALDAWFARACAADPDERFETVAACVEALLGAAGLSGAGFVESPGRAPGPTGRLRGPEIAALRAGGSSPPPDAAGNDEGFGTGGAVLPPAREGGPLLARRSRLAWAFGTLAIAVAFASLGAMLSRARGESPKAEARVHLGGGGPEASEAIARPSAAEAVTASPPEAKADKVPPAEAPAHASPAAPEPAAAHAADKARVSSPAPPRPAPPARPASRPAKAPAPPDLGYLGPVPQPRASARGWGRSEHVQPAGARPLRATSACSAARASLTRTGKPSPASRGASLRRASGAAARSRKKRSRAARAL